MTHVDLLLENPVKLPFLNVELPLEAFFFLAPILFLIVHSFTLSKLVILSDKARRFHEELLTQIKDAAERDGLRRQLPSNIFVQGLAGPKSVRESPFGWFLRAMGWISMVLAPVLLLLLLQLQFLPYHDVWLTWVHRLALLADLVLLWWLWPKVLDGDSERHPSPSPQETRPRWLSVAMSAAALAFAALVAGFPGERPERPWQAIFDRAFAAASWPKNALSLPELNIWEALKVESPEKIAWKDHTIGLKGRHLEGANFDGAKLGKADLRVAQLQGATLDYAQLQGATLDHAQLQGASLRVAQLQGASLNHTRLEGAVLNGAKLQGASIIFAYLQGAMLALANLQGAALLQAYAEGASLDGAELGGAQLDLARLQGASLNRAQLQGTSFFKAQLQGANLEHAKLQATLLVGAFLWRSRWLDVQAKQLVTTGWNWRSEAPPEDSPLHDGTPWTQTRYKSLRKELEGVIARGPMRDAALQRIERLQCVSGVCDATADFKTFWEQQLDMVGENEANFKNYGKALAETLQQLLCNGDANAIHILRGVVHNGRLSNTGTDARALLDFAMSDKCLVSAALTNEDKSRLREIKREAEKEYPPPAPSLSAPAPPTQKPK